MTRGITVVAAKIREIRNNPSPTAKEEDLLTTLEACYEFYKRGFDFDAIDLYESDAVKFRITPDGRLRPRLSWPSVVSAKRAAFDIVKSRAGPGVHLRGGVLHELSEGLEEPIIEQMKGPSAPLGFSAGDKPNDAVLGG